MASAQKLWIDDRTGRFASSLIALGQLGFWVQLVFLITIVVLGGVVFQIVSGGFKLGNILSFAGLALPVFTTFWCRHLAGLGRRLAGTGERPSSKTVIRRVWVGVWAGAIGSLLSLVSLFGAASAMLLIMLANPQVGIQISPSEGGATPYTISAVDAVSIMSLLLTLIAELLVVAVCLRFVFLASWATKDDTYT